jgi:aminopeptidase YwaD
VPDIKREKLHFHIMTCRIGSGNIAARVVEKHPGITEGKPWPQGDHSIFLHYGRPAIAVSSEWFIENIDNQDITHTPKDNIGIVDCNKLVELAAALSDLIIRI